MDRYNDAFGEVSSRFSCITFDIRSFNKHIETFTTMLNALSRKQNVVVLTETWIDPGFEEFHALQGYNGFHCIRLGRSGGVSVYSTENLSARRIDELSVSNAVVESCVVEILIRSETFIIFAIYRPHSESKEEFILAIDGMLQSDLLRGKTVIVMGDLNIDLLKQGNIHVTAFVDNMRSLNYLPLITKPTRFPVGEGAGSPSLLDHIWFNSLRRVESEIISIDMTDHCPTFIDVIAAIDSEEKNKLSLLIHHIQYIRKFKCELDQLCNNFVFEGCIDTRTADFIKAIMRCMYDAFH